MRINKLPLQHAGGLSAGRPVRAQARGAAEAVRARGRLQRLVGETDVHARKARHRLATLREPQAQKVLELHVAVSFNLRDAAADFLVQPFSDFGPTVVTFTIINTCITTPSLSLSLTHSLIDSLNDSVTHPAQSLAV